jgi:hypothetical protein
VSAFGESDRTPGPLSERAGERGIALILVLWVPDLLSVLAVGFAGNARTELLIVRNQIEAAHAPVRLRRGYLARNPRNDASQPRAAVDC